MSQILYEISATCIKVILASMGLKMNRSQYSRIFLGEVEAADEMGVPDSSKSESHGPR